VVTPEAVLGTSNMAKESSLSYKRGFLSARPRHTSSRIPVLIFPRHSLAFCSTEFCLRPRRLHKWKADEFLANAVGKRRRALGKELRLLTKERIDRRET